MSKTLSSVLSRITNEARAIKESLSLEIRRNEDPDLRIDEGDRLIGRGNEQYQSKVMEMAQFLGEVYSGSRPQYHLREAMTISDFPNLFGDVLYRQLLGNYMPYPVTYTSWCRTVKAPDFRKIHLYAIDGGQGLLSTVKEREPYPEVVFSETPYNVAVAKYGKRYGVSFEMMVNDDLNAFQQRPMMMAQAVRRSEEWLATGMLCDSNGPNATFFTTGHKNIVTGNPALSIQSLQTAYGVLAAQLDADGQPIVIDAIKLVVGPALKVTAENIMHATQLRINSSSGNPAGALQGGGTLDQYLYTGNWMVGLTELLINPYIPYIATTNGSTSWFLIANPNDLSQRPAFVFANLMGYDKPQLFMKAPNSIALGGGSSDPMDGSFENDAIDYKVRHFFGVTPVDTRMAVGSSGSGG